MDARIGHLRNRFRVVGAGARAAATARLERVVRDQLAAGFGDALAPTFEGDEAVYVLRRVRAGVVLTAGDGATDAGLARAWGERMAGAVVRAVARDEGDGANLVRFEDQADYVSHFIAAVLGGEAWGRWYFGAFAPLRTLTSRDVLRAVLFEHRAHVPAILGRLQSRGQLDALLDALDAETRRALWRERDERDATAVDAEALRPVFAAALQLADDLALWDGREGEALLSAYAVSRPHAPDWRDARSLAASLLNALSFLNGRGLLRRGVAGEEFRARLDAALAGLDWLDAAWLKEEVARLFGGAAALPVRAARAGPTPRQRELLRTLAGLAGEGALRLEHAGDLWADALRVWALIAAHAPAWADDAAARAVIQHLLEVARLLRGSSSADELLLRLRRGDAAGALSLLSGEERAGASEACRVVAELGAPALEVAAALAGVEEKARAGAWVESSCAGLALLLRAALEVRLHALAAEAGYPPGDTGQFSTEDGRERFTAETQSAQRERGGVELTSSSAPPPRPPRLCGESHFASLLLALGLRLGGEETISPDGLIDEGLCMLAGLRAVEGDEPRPTREMLSEAWGAAGTEDHARFQSALLGAAAGQRLLSAAEMRISRVRLEGVGEVLIACDETRMVWPLGRVLVGEDGEAEATVAAWLAAWEAATGVRPAVVFDEVASELREELSAAWRALSHGRLGHAGADLNIFLGACLLLRVWARWLRQFSKSGVPYLLDNFVRRAGRLRAGERGLVVELERGPLDVVVEMAGYLSELERVPWLEGGRVRFSLRGA
jgi:hypothetical protein